MKYILLFATALLFISCDGTLEVQVLVLDSETNKPLEKVTIKELNSEFTAFTDADGYFEYSHTVGAPFGKSEMTMVFSKDHYITDTLVLRNYEQPFLKLRRAE
jgi:hypothetical protein